MIGLAVLYWLCGHIAELEVGVNAFYEDLPIDPQTGSMERYGVYITTGSAPMTPNGDLHQYLTVYVAIGEGATNRQGAHVPEKYETDKLLDAIQGLVLNATRYYQELCHLSVPDTELVYTDVRLLPSSSKVRGGTLTNGAIVKSLVAEVYYKEKEKEANNG